MFFAGRHRLPTRIAFVTKTFADKGGPSYAATSRNTATQAGLECSNATFTRSRLNFHPNHDHSSSLDHLDWPACVGCFLTVVERVSSYSSALAGAWDSEAGQECLFAVYRLDSVGCSGDFGHSGLWLTR